MKSYDSIIIGFGKGGKTLAGKLAQTGRKVAIVEKSSGMYGGTCINVGCIPSKSLFRSAGISHLSADAPFAQKAEFYRAAVAEKRRLTAMLREKNYRKLADLVNVDVYTGTAGFLSPTQVQVKLPQETLVLEGKQIFINTGASSFVPPIPGLENNPDVFFSDTLMDLETLPQRLTIIGGGYIGLEFASMYANFGSRVTVLQVEDTFLPREDPDMALEIQKALEAKGIRFRFSVSIQKAEGGNVVLSDGIVEGDAILVATGRKPNTADLNAAAAGVSLTPRGAVQVDESLRTTAPNIWAMGDVVGGLQFTYISLDDFRIVWSQLNGGGDTTARRKNVPYSVFIDPPFSRVGMSEAEALAAGRSIKVLKLPAAAVPKAQVLQQPTGMLKAVLDANTNKILGASLFCEESYEVINLIHLAMELDADASVLQNQIFTHPTMSEALNDLFSL